MLFLLMIIAFFIFSKMSLGVNRDSFDNDFYHQRNKWSLDRNKCFHWSCSKCIIQKSNSAIHNFWCNWHFLYLHFVVSYFVMQLIYSVETSLIQTRLKLFYLFILQVINILQIGRKTNCDSIPLKRFRTSKHNINWTNFRRQQNYSLRSWGQMKIPIS